MTYSNDERENRLRHVPEPVFRREPIRELERDDFEDRSLDTTLRVLADSYHDGDSFLFRVKAKTENKPKHKVEVHDHSFFGLAEPLYTGPQDSQSEFTPSLSSIEASNQPSKKRNPLLVAGTTVAASILFGFVAWYAWLQSTTGIGSSVVVNEINLSKPSETEISKDAPASQIAVKLPHETRAIPESEQLQETNLEKDQATALVTTDEPSGTPNSETVANASTMSNPGPYFHLRFHFANTKKGSLSIGETRIKSEIPFEQAAPIIKCVCHEVAKEVHFYLPIMQNPWQGKLTISGPDFAFEEQFVGLDEMFDAGLLVRKKFKGRIEQADFQSSENSNTMPLARQQSWPDQIHDQVTEKALSITDELLEDSLDPETFKTTNSVRYRNFAQLRKRDARLQNFARGGIAKRKGNQPFGDFRVFHAKSADQLKVELEQAPLFDLFDDSDEFKSWVRDVVKSTEKGRIRLQIKELDREWETLDRKSKNLSYSGQERYVLHKQAQAVRTEIANLRQKSKTASVKPGINRNSTIEELIPKKPQLNGLDLAMGDECHLCDSDATTLNEVSKHFGSILARFDSFGSRNNPDKSNESRAGMIRAVIQSVLLHDNPEQAIGTIDQMLQIEKKDARLELVKVLGRMDSNATCRLLACYAKYDIDSEVRIAATDALRTYPPEVSREELMEGFSYPWPDAARHAAEALVRLNDTDSIPRLVDLLDRPDPRAPQALSDGRLVRRELVAINHLRNCLLCHMDSHSEDDPGRGLVPSWTMSLPQLYYQERDPRFARVRADITYLRQDFSILRKVEKPGMWPKNQRFDYVVMNKAINNKQAIEFRNALESQPNEYRASVDAALRGLTGKSPLGSSVEDWKSVLEIQ